MEKSGDGKPNPPLLHHSVLVSVPGSAIFQCKSSAYVFFPNTMMCWRGSTSLVFSQRKGKNDISFLTCASVILCKGLIGTCGSSARNSTNTTRPDGFNAWQMFDIIS